MTAIMTAGPATGLRWRQEDRFCHVIAAAPGPRQPRFNDMSELIDNRAHRVRTLKEIIRQLHEGRAPAEVRARLTALVRQCDASEIASMEQELMEEGVPVAQIMGMCDLHASVVRDILVERKPVEAVPPGHPVDTFRRENAALSAQVEKLRGALQELGAGAGGGSAAPEAADRAKRLFGELMDVDKHYQRKEQLLFSCLERHGVTGPSKVMWGKDDEVRGGLKALGTAMGVPSATAAEWLAVARDLAEPALRAVEEMVFKEERILLPMALQNLSEDEWAEIFAQSPQFGYCLVDPGRGYEPPARTSDVSESARAEASREGVTFAAARPGRVLLMAGAPSGPAAPAETEASGALVFPSGSFTLVQLKAIFAALPVDLTLVGADDRVKFFSEGKDRIFARPLAIIGRLVQHCHPPSSVDVVERILADFRSGRESVAEFWIEMHGRFVHIRYFALRDERNEYLGCLEVTQDLTRERKLEGERRLLQYDET
jgi:uncharacterized protein